MKDMSHLISKITTVKALSVDPKVRLLMPNQSATLIKQVLETRNWMQIKLLEPSLTVWPRSIDKDNKEWIAV